jgi:peptide/nickel transport system substrate-binding protein
MMNSIKLRNVLLKASKALRIAVLSTLAVSVSLSAIATPASGKILRWGANGDVASMDPQAYYTTMSMSLLGNIYEALVRYNTDFKFEPALALRWERREPNIYRFWLRQGVHFHNGDVMTADDVVATLMRAADPHSPMQPVAQQIKEVVKIDAYTVDVVLKNSYSMLLNDIAFLPIMDRKWLQEHDALRPVNPANGEESYATSHANGTGPFSLKERRPDVEITLERFPGWWDTPKHNLDGIVYRPIPYDATRVAALLSGELDLITPAPVQDVDRINSGNNTAALVGLDLRIMVLGLNQNDRLNDSSITNANPLRDVQVRKALMQSIDSQTISSRIMKGLSKPTKSIVAPQIQGYDPSLSEDIAPFSVDAAKALLAKAGYPDGFTVGMDCPNDAYINAEQICQAIAAMWAKVGVKTNLQITASSIQERKILNKQSDIYLMGWANVPQLNAYSILNNVIRKGGSWNPAGYSNDKINELIPRIAAATDAKTALAETVEALQIQKADFAPSTGRPSRLGHFESHRSQADV